MVFQDTNFINIFFSLLRSGLYGIPIPDSDLPEKIEWKSVIALAQKHFVLGTIIESVPLLPERLRPSSSTLTKMNKFALGLIQTNLIFDKTIATLVTFFKQHGINGVLLKGQGVARCYRLPQMRQTGDIDFYVGKKVYKKAVSLCKEYLIQDVREDCDENEQHFDFKMDGVLIELHRLATRIYSPFRKKQFQDWIVDQLEGSQNRRILTLGDTDVTIPSLDFDVIYIFYHAWRHFIMGGIGLRQLCDWAMIFQTHSCDINNERLVRNIQRFGLIKGWKLFACIAVRYLGVSEEKIPLYDPSYSKKSEKILEEIITGGNFGFYSKANTRTPIYGFGLWHGLGKVRNVTQYFVSLFPIIPVEATFLYFNRLIFGTIANLKRSKKKSNQSAS